MRWNYHDISYIREDLKQKGLAKGALLDELLDHVCCEVELQMEKGVDFKKAYETVLSTVHERQFRELQDESFKAKNYTSTIMVKNIFKIMWRNALKYRLHTLISLTGLIIGFTCFLIISLYLSHELNYDKLFTKSTNLFRVTMSSTVGGIDNKIPTSYAPIGPELRAKYEEVADYVRIINYKYTRQQPTFRNGDKVFYEDKVIFADSNFFQLFDFDFLEGDAATALQHPNSVVMTKEMAAKYFGERSALGKFIRFNSTEMVVAGVLSRLPTQTHMQFDFVIPITGLGSSGVYQSVGPNALESWDVDWFWTYLYLPDVSSVVKIEQGINSLVRERNPQSYADHNLKFYLQPLRDIHLYSDFDYNTDLTQNGNRTNLFILATVGFLVLFISAINFVNISLASATRRYKEVGISKVLGAMRGQLRLHYLMESIVLCSIAMALAIAVSGVVLPIFSAVIGTPLSLSPLLDPVWISSVMIFTLLLGVCAGAYPALFVSAFEPQQVLKGVWKPGTGGASFRKVLIGVQICISIFLIVGTILVSKQLQLIHDRSLGYDKDQILMLPIRGTSIPKSFVSFKNELMAESAIAGVSSLSEPIGREVQFMSFNIEGKESLQFVKIMNITHDFVKTMGLQLVEGRDFSPSIASDSISGFIINESAARAFGWDEPLGKGIQHFWRPGNDGHVIGVVKDFNFEPLQKEIDPIILWFGRPLWYAAVRIEKGQHDAALNALKKTWERFEAEKPFAFQYLDESIQKVYAEEQQMGKLFYICTLLSLFTAMLGLYGLISFVLDQRLREIGVRKVMGATQLSIISLLSKDYVLLVIISFTVSIPLTYWAIEQWLQDFAYKISFSVWYFVAGLVVALIIVLGTVLLKAIGVAGLNPTSVLRSE